MSAWRPGGAAGDGAGQSLVRRVVVSIVLAELVCVLALALISIAHERRVRLRAIDVALQGRADSLFGAVQDAEDEGDSVLVDSREIQLPSQDIFAVYDGSGRRIGASASASEELVHPSSAGVRTRHAGDHTYRVIEQSHLRIIDRAESGGRGMERPVTIVYATQVDRIWEEVFDAVGFYLVASVLLILGTTLLMTALIRRVLQPLRELASAAGAVSARELAFRAPASALEVSELRPLATTLAATIDGLKTAFERQHRFIGDAAHELKTAVSVVRSSLQVLLVRDRSALEYQAGVVRALEDNARLEELVSRMLLLARLEEQAAWAPGRAHLAQVARAAALRLQTTFDAAGITLSAAISGEGEVALGANDLEVLLSNLLTNAVEHSPRGATVCLRVRAGEHSAVIRIDDEGEGIDQEALSHVYERFYRTDVSRARTTGGAGLGLSIVSVEFGIVGGSG